MLEQTGRTLEVTRRRAGASRASNRQHPHHADRPGEAHRLRHRQTVDAAPVTETGAGDGARRSTSRRSRPSVRTPRRPATCTRWESSAAEATASPATAALTVAMKRIRGPRRRCRRPAAERARADQITLVKIGDAVSHRRPVPPTRWPRCVPAAPARPNSAPHDQGHAGRHSQHQSPTTGRRVRARHHGAAPSEYRHRPPPPANVPSARVSGRCCEPPVFGARWPSSARS